MTVSKWVAVVVLGVGGLWAIALGAMEGRLAAKGPLLPRPVEPIALRAFLDLPPEPAADAGRTLPSPSPAQFDAGSAAAAPPQPPAAAVHAPAPQPKLSRPPAPRLADGLLNLRASAAADVYVDGKRAGSSPVLSFKVKAGTHRIRFDCLDAEGKATPGPANSVTVAADAGEDVDYTCPEVPEASE